MCFFFQAEDGIRDLVRSRGLGDVYKRQDVFSSSRFGFDGFGHGDGHKAYNQFVLHEGQVMRVQDPSFPSGEVELTGFTHKDELNEKGKKIDIYCLLYTSPSPRDRTRSRMPSSA